MMTCLEARRIAAGAPSVKTAPTERSANGSRSAPRKTRLRYAWAWVPARSRRYSPARRGADGESIVQPITADIEAGLDRLQLAGRLGTEWVPPGFCPIR